MCIMLIFVAMATGLFILKSKEGACQAINSACRCRWMDHRFDKKLCFEGRPLIPDRSDILARSFSSMHIGMWMRCECDAMASRAGFNNELRCEIGRLRAYGLSDRVPELLLEREGCSSHGGLGERIQVRRYLWKPTLLPVLGCLLVSS
jgi:hypothetical protein